MHSVIEIKYSDTIIFKCLRILVPRVTNIKLKSHLTKGVSYIIYNVEYIFIDLLANIVKTNV